MYHEDGSVKGIATNDVGIHKDGSPKVMFELVYFFNIEGALMLSILMPMCTTKPCPLIDPNLYLHQVFPNNYPFIEDNRN